MSDVNGDAMLNIDDTKSENEKVYISIVGFDTKIKTIAELRVNKNIILTESKTYLDTQSNVKMLSDKIETKLNDNSFSIIYSISGPNCEMPAHKTEKLFCSRANAILKYEKLMNRLTWEISK